MRTRRDKSTSGIWLDATERYGLISRILHWAMAYLLVWQFGVIIAYRLFGPLEIIKTITWYGPYHGTVGLLTFLLVMARAAWTLLNRRRRPSYARGWAGRVAAIGHVALYLTMFAVPAVALLRSYGGGHGWSPWGVPFIPATGQRIEWMVAIGDASHRILAWTLAAFMAGHIAMAFVHGTIFQDGILSRMAGSLRRRSSSSHQDQPPTKATPHVA